ncbi:hypothetical protein ACSQ67_023531 [Phaseolus vulgaris]
MTWLAATWFGVKDQDRNSGTTVRDWSDGYSRPWRHGGVGVGEGEQWRRTMTIDGPVVISPNGIQYPLLLQSGS